MKFSIQQPKDLEKIKTFILFVCEEESEGKGKKNKKEKKSSFFNHEVKFLETFEASFKNSKNLNLAKHFSEAFKSKTLMGRKGEVLLFRKVDSVLKKNLLYVGLGKKRLLTLESYRQAAGKAYSFLKQSDLLYPVSFLIPSVNFISLGRNFDLKKEVLENSSMDFYFPNVVQAAIEGFYISSYSFDEYKSGGSKGVKGYKKSGLKGLHNKAEFGNRIQDVFIGFEEKNLLLKDQKSSSGTLTKKKNQLKKQVLESLKKATILSESVHLVRRVSDTPGNLMTPEILSKEVLKEARGVPGLSVSVWKKDKIKQEKMGGLYGVSLGGGVEPRFIIMNYKGRKDSSKPLCFVGKGLTFDSGGISIKPSSKMHEMKYDMCGGATVIGALLAIAKLKLKVNVLGLVPASENMPGPMANKPGDILVARNGKSVEVLNTDAEGRLILMDALSYACEKSPQVIFDIATLTGSIIVALGNVYTGVFTRSDEVWNKISLASQKTGERFWRMPLDDFHVEDMKGTHADLSNISSYGGAGSSTAAAFLEAFVEEEIPWAHFDIAGTAWSVGRRLKYCPSFGASGAVLRTFVALAEQYQN